MYVRFVGKKIHRSSGRREGIFHASGALLASGLLAEYDAARLTELRAWFDENLVKPSRFARARRSHPAPVGICWFKSSAREHVSRVREIAQIAESYGVTIEMIATRRPGYVVYEDEAQLVAAPFNDTPA
jgi:hypothetical protein